MHVDDELRQKQQQKLEQVRKLLAKAQDPGCTPEEAEALLMKVAELEARYSIDREMLAGQVDSNAARVIADQIINIEGPYPRPKTDFLASLAKVVGCEAVIVQAGGNRFWVELVGTETDLERLESLYTKLLQTATLAIVYASCPPGQGLKSFKRAFLMGFFDRVLTRLGQIEARTITVTASEYRERLARDGKPSVELVLASKADAVQARFDAKYASKKFESFKIQTSCHVGYGAGDHAGQRADLGQKGFGGSVRGELT